VWKSLRIAWKNTKRRVLSGEVDNEILSLDFKDIFHLPFIIFHLPFIPIPYDLVQMYERDHANGKWKMNNGKWKIGEYELLNELRIKTA
jgi:hypothetical protein